MKAPEINPEVSWLLERIAEFDRKTAVITVERTYTFSELSQRINQYLAEIKAEIPEGAIVAILSDYSFEAIAVFMALMANRNIVVPVTNTVENEIADRLVESQSDFTLKLASEGIRITAVEPILTGKHGLISSLVANRHAGLILFSSGSTGKPKAMVHNLDKLVDSYRDKRPKDLVMLVFLMFDHIGGLNTLFNSLSMGTSIVIPQERDVEKVCRLIEKHKVNILPSSPTFLNLILMSGAPERFDFSSLKMITYGTEPMPESLLVKLKKYFPRVRFLQTFGTSETGIAQTNSKTSSSTLIRIENGVTEHKIVDNELWLRSETQILGYLNASMESFTEDGWFKTGDLVEEAGDGYLRIVGRSKEVINVGGEKVLPAEVESALLQMPEVVDCLVYGEQSPIVGQIVVADVVVAGEMKSSKLKSLARAFLRERLDSYKVPVKFRIVEATQFTDRFKKVRKKD